MQTDFWKHKTLQEMTPTEWEALCDGCARCCLYKLEDEDGSIYYTKVACRYLDLETCQCTSYETRHQVMPSCVLLDVQKVDELSWLPPTCAYRLLAQRRDLPTWHQLVCGNPEAIHNVGISLRSTAISEAEVDMENLENYVVDWFDTE